MFADFSTIWENNDGCADQYICETAVSLLSMLVHAYNVIIDICGGEVRHDREVVCGLSATDKQFLSIILKTVQMIVVVLYDTQMKMHISTVNTEISLVRGVLKHLSDP